ncbi:elongation of very long chain fatty acids protein AAEL008004-like [Spodoptera litura]|uniref:Elongation of very long chain fatty acids protein n=1 Tax=Spodoptera litura TaxID=69820 RepID=A0A9J7DU76_SPOLT|nr:elongation of very long chain fatty acids protein AAEL008004-like [Spodoptera litura]
MAVVQQALQGYHYVFDELSDPRTKDWWLISGPGPLLTIIATYLYFCTKAGPRYMKDKKPYNLKGVVMVYNIFQIILSLFMTVLGFSFFLTESYENKCYSVDYSDNPRAMLWASGAWWFFFAKITELLDTVFFVLRKKDRQISFLHLYHHSIMPIIGWIGVKYAAGGQSIPEGCINAFIHVVMYTYYLISGLGPQYQKYLWWKKHLTTMQLIQFCIIVYLNVNSLFSSSCNYPKYLSIFVMMNCFAFFYMFGKFYYNSYVQGTKKQFVPICLKSQ